MAGTNGSPDQANPAPVSRIVLTFPNGAGSAQMNVSIENVQPGQVYAAAFLMDQLGREIRMQEVMQQRPVATAVPADVQAVVSQILGRKP